MGNFAKTHTRLHLIITFGELFRKADQMLQKSLDVVFWDRLKDWKIEAPPIEN